MRRFFSVLLCALFVMCAGAPGSAGDRVIIYSGENPSSQKTNQSSRDFRIALGTWMRDALGPNPGVFANLQILPSFTGMNIVVGLATAGTPGAVYQLRADDTAPMGSADATQLPSDSTKIVVQGLQTATSPVIGPFAAPTVPGQSVYYLLEAQVQTVDTTPTATTFINASGQRSTATAYRDRQDQLVYQLVPGAASGSPSVPTTDPGYVPIGTILIPYGTSAITAGMIVTYPPFSGFLANGGHVSFSALTLAGFSAGCLQTDTVGRVGSFACTSGLGNVVGTSPVNVVTSGSIATVKIQASIAHACPFIDAVANLAAYACFNVRAYGAVGDGTTDDTAAILAAFAAAKSATPSALYFPAGTYLLGADLSPIASNFSIVGDGYNLSTIKSTLSTCTEANSCAIIDNRVSNTGQSHVQISGLTLDANSEPQMSCIRLAGSGALWSDVLFANNRCQHANLRWASQFCTPTGNVAGDAGCTQMRIANNLYVDNTTLTYEVLIIGDSRDSMISGNIFRGNTGLGCCASVISVYGYNQHLKLNGNTFDANTTAGSPHNDVLVQQSQYVDIQNNSFIGTSTGNSVEIRNSQNVVVRGNTCRHGGQGVCFGVNDSNAQSFDGNPVLIWNSAHIIIDDNTCYGTDVGMAYCVIVPDGVGADKNVAMQDITVSNNTAAGVFTQTPFALNASTAAAVGSFASVWPSASPSPEPSCICGASSGMANISFNNDRIAAGTTWNNLGGFNLVGNAAVTGAKVLNPDVGNNAASVGSAINCTGTGFLCTVNGGDLSTFGANPISGLKTASGNYAAAINAFGANPVGFLGAGGSGGVPAVGSSTVAVQNPFPFGVRIYINGGTYTDVAIGVSSGSMHSVGQAATSAVLGVGEWVSVTYSSAPTWIWYGL